jgi:hypothetical protein
MKKVALSPAAAFASGTIPIEPMATAKARLDESKLLFIGVTPYRRLGWLREKTSDGLT